MRPHYHKTPPDVSILFNTQIEGGKLIETDGHSIAGFNIGGKVYAIDNTCTHRGGPLAEGMVAEDEVICGWHGARFNIRTGAVCGPPATAGVRAYPVRVNGDDVEVEIE